jgi:NAD(P)-dependent dehydrogenase (short-subunit alcohol dehydrogenase family)
MDLQGRVALITGGSGGIGEALAYELVNAGGLVVLFARRRTELERVAGNIGPDKAAIVVGDVKQPADIQRGVDVALERFGRLDILVNNAGIGVVGELSAMPPELLEEAWRVNVLGPILGVQVATPALEKTCGLIVNISSGTSMRPSPNLGGYSTTKAALNLVSDTLRAELGQRGIRVLNVMPGQIYNDFVANAYFTDPEFAAARKADIEANRGRGRSSQDAARDIIEAIRKDLQEFRYEPPRAADTSAV